MKSGPDLTAFVVALSQLALRRNPLWGRFVPEDAAMFYKGFTHEAAFADITLRMLSFIPDPFKIHLLEMANDKGFVRYIAMRKQAVERRAREVLAQGALQVVVIGAGFDALALRLAAEFPHVRFYEMDRDPTQRCKREAVKNLGLEAPPNLHFIACDLAETPISSVLVAESSFRAEAETLYIAEGLSMYLTEEENRSWVQAVRDLSGAGAHLIMTAVEQIEAGCARGEALRSLFLGRRGSAFRWCANVGYMKDFLGKCGFGLEQTLTYAELQQEACTEAEREGIRNAAAVEHVYFARAGKDVS